MRRSNRLATLPKRYYGNPTPRRKRVRITLKAYIQNYAMGGNMANYLGQNILNPDTGSANLMPITLTATAFVHEDDETIPRFAADNITQRANGYINGMGYYAITKEFLQQITSPALLREVEVRRFVQEQFKAMHAYSWAASVAFVNPTFTIEEVNADGLLRTGRIPKRYPMLSVKPIRLPFLKHHIANISLETLNKNEQCVPSALFYWLSARVHGKNGNKRMPEKACIAYPDALKGQPKGKNKYISKPTVTIENVIALLNAIHHKNLNTDEGHTIEDVKDFCQLFGCKMYALDDQGLVIDEVADGDKNEPLCFTCAHRHMYLHADADDVRSIANVAREQRETLSKTYRPQQLQLENQKSKEDYKFQLIEGCDIMNGFDVAENTSFLVKGYRDVEEIFKKHGWTYGAPKFIRTKHKRITRFIVKRGAISIRIGADPFHDQVLLAHRKNQTFDHEALLESCKAKSIELNPLDGFGRAVMTILSKEKRPKISKDVRNEIFECQMKTCCICEVAFDDVTDGNIDHKIPRAAGGSDEPDNLQWLCLDCHRTKTETENQTGYNEHHMSRFNGYTLDTVLSPNFQFLEFCESWWPCSGMKVTSDYHDVLTIQSRNEDGSYCLSIGNTNATVDLPVYKFSMSSYEELLKHPDAPATFKCNASKNPDKIELRKLDINNCRRNIEYFPLNDFAVFTAIDKVEPFDGTLQPGTHYFVDTNLAFPFHGSGWYRFALISESLKSNIIAKEQILLQFAPTSVLSKEHFVHASNDWRVLLVQIRSYKKY